jgi:hypothetical protein
VSPAPARHNRGGGVTMGDCKREIPRGSAAGGDTITRRASPAPRHVSQWTAGAERVDNGRRPGNALGSVLLARVSV